MASTMANHCATSKSALAWTGQSAARRLLLGGIGLSFGAVACLQSATLSTPALTKAFYDQHIRTTARLCHCEEVTDEQCQAQIPREGTAFAVKPATTKVGSQLLSFAKGFLGWSFLATMWATALFMPAALIWAVFQGNWGIASSMIGLYAFPHLLPVPKLPAECRQMLRNALMEWMPSVTVVDPRGRRTMGAFEPEAEPEPRRQIAERAHRKLYCVHPHGIMTFGVFVFHAAVEPHARLCMGPFLYHAAPLFRIAAELSGIKCGSAGKSDFLSYMKADDTPLALVPGGFQEATISALGHERVFLKHRKGFVKYALQYGYDLVPCYTIGESDLYANPQGGWKWRFGLNNLGIPAVLPWGHFILGLLPRRGVSITLVVGETVDLPRIQRPSAADIDKYHARYVEALKAAYLWAKKGTQSENRPLEVW